MAADQLHRPPTANRRYGRYTDCWARQNGKLVRGIRACGAVKIPSFRGDANIEPGTHTAECYP